MAARILLSALLLGVATGVSATEPSVLHWPLVIGHRGLGQNHAPEPENSISALVGAFAAGASAVEFDVQLSADGEVVLAHDPRLERMTNGQGCISESSLLELRRLSLIDGFKAVHPELSISTLREALEVIRGFDSPERPFLADIHIKVYDYFRGDMVGLDNGGCEHTDYATLTRQALLITRELGLLNRVIFTSFDHRVLNLIKAQEPESEVGLLTLFVPHLAVIEAMGRYEYVALNHRRFELEDVRLAHRNGLRVLAWSPSEREQFSRALAAGVDGLISDNVPAAVEVRWGR